MAYNSTEGFIRSKSVLVECLGYLIYRVIISSTNKNKLIFLFHLLIYSILVALAKDK